MSQQTSLQIQVSPQFAAAIPPEPLATKQVVALSALAISPESRGQLVCQRLLVGDTRVRAMAEASDVLGRILTNTQVLAVFGNDDMDDVNRLNDRMLSDRPPVDVPELQDAMRQLSHEVRTLGRRYDPSDPKVLKKYEGAKGRVRSALHLGRTFLEEFLDDIRSLQGQFEQVIQTLEGKQYQLLRNVTYYDEFYRLNEQEIAKLIYTIGVMEIIRDMAVEKASKVVVGDSSMGDRGAEAQAQISEIVTYLENKIIAFKGRLWVAWAMAPQIRNMRAISVGLSARVDQTLDVTIPTMKNVVVVWLTLSEAQQTAEFNKAVEDTFNNVMTMFAEATKATVPLVANSLSTPALDPRTVVAWSESLSAQADGMIQALKDGAEKREALEQAMIAGKEVIDSATQRLNQARLEQVLAAAQEAPLEISRSVSAS